MRKNKKVKVQMIFIINPVATAAESEISINSICIDFTRLLTLANKIKGFVSDMKVHYLKIQNRVQRQRNNITWT